MAAFEQILLGLLPELRRYAFVVADGAKNADAVLARALADVLDRHSPEIEPEIGEAELRLACYRAIYRKLGVSGTNGSCVPDSVFADGPENGASARFAAGQSFAGAAAAFHSLGTDARQVIALTSVAGLSQQQAAAVLGVSLPEYKARLTEARQDLSAAFADDLAEFD